MLRNFPLLLLLACLALPVGGGAVCADQPRPADPTPSARPVADDPFKIPAITSRLGGRQYPIETSVSFCAGLFHWLDSLSGIHGPGLSAGKTVEAHRRAFDRAFGGPSDAESEMLRVWGELRREFVKRSLRAPSPRDRRNPSELLVAFYEEPTVEAALVRAEVLLDAETHERLRVILSHFAAKYVRLWDGGRVPLDFLERAAADRRLAELERLLGRIARFFDVDPLRKPHPRLVLVPVESGFGTHAQADGHHLLIELRPADRLAHAASVIVHENSHLLFGRIGPERIDRLNRRLLSRGEGAREAGELLREALPTALGQGLADRLFRRSGWSMALPWYHRPDVDRYAKRLYPLVRRSVENGGRLDAEFVDRAVELYTGLGPTRRSP